MKKKGLTIAIIIGLTALISCGPKAPEASETKAETSEGKVATSLVDIGCPTDPYYPLDLALMDIGRYYNSMKTHFAGEIPLKAFTLNTRDLVIAMGITCDTSQILTKHIRAYIGLDQNGDYKLFVVPVNGFNPCIKEAGKDSIFGSYVLDLNYPCPTLCDDSSILMHPTDSLAGTAETAPEQK